MAYILVHRTVKYKNQLVEKNKELMQKITDSFFVRWSTKTVVDWPSPVSLPISTATNAMT